MNTTMTTTTRTSKAEEILRKPYTRRLLPDESGGYVATIQEFPGCVAEGETAEEALANLDRAAASWIEVSLANGREIREPISFGGYSGKIALRIPRGLHRQVAELAELEGASINQLLTAAIASYISGKQVAHNVLTAAQVAAPTESKVDRMDVGRLISWAFKEELDSGSHVKTSWTSAAGGGKTYAVANFFRLALANHVMANVILDHKNFVVAGTVPSEMPDDPHSVDARESHPQPHTRYGIAHRHPAASPPISENLWKVLQ